MTLPMDGGHLVLDADGALICALPDGERPAEVVAANAELIALSSDLYRSVRNLVAVMRASCVETSHGKSCDSDDWDAALEDAQSLIDLLADDCVVLDEAEGSADGLVVIPVPMMQPPVVVTAFKAGNGDVAFVVHADDERKTFIGQYGIAAPMFAWARSSLQEDGPLIAVLRNERQLVGEIGFFQGRVLKLRLNANTLNEQIHSVELAQEDLDDIINLFGEN